MCPYKLPRTADYNVVHVYYYVDTKMHVCLFNGCRIALFLMNIFYIEWSLVVLEKTKLFRASWTQLPHFFFLKCLFIYLVAPGLIYLFIFIFIFGCVGSSFLCEGFLQLRQAGATHHRGAWASSLSRPLLLRSTSSRRAGSVAVAHGPSCSTACGIFPDQGSNPCPPH